jgi:glycosyltransferase involved in cell wall biosynthesis
MLKVALIHDWLTGMRGGEKCLEVLCELYPDADLYTLLYFKNRLSGIIERMNIKTSFIQKLPMASRYYRYYLPLFPMAIERFDLKGYDLVVSTSHCVAKGILPPPDALHISYCFTPMRYIWDMRFEYFKSSDHEFQNLVTSFFSNYLRIWDVTSSERVDHFIAISKHVKKRIEKFYRRFSTVIYPPVDCDFFCPSRSSNERGDYFLMVTALAPYKRVDTAIQAFNRLGKTLLVIGDGQGLKSLQKMAKKNIEFLGWQSNEKVRDYYRGCRAFIFPGEEDFGIAPVEAQACGKPVIAYGRGGILESVVPFPQENFTGFIFDQPTPESLIHAIELFEKNFNRFDGEKIKTHALRFHKNNFREEIKSFIHKRYQEFIAGRENMKGGSIA